MSPLSGRTIALALTGSIAAYKSVEVARLCIKAGAKVLPVMSASAARFVGPVTLAGICGESVAVDMWDPSFSGEMHVSLSDRADVVAIVPATADTLARLATGRADDLVAALALSAKGPVLVAPAMHPRMWSHPATSKNVAELARQGRITFVGPTDGQVASGESGMGRMAEPAQIALAIEALVVGRRDLQGKRLLVTAGPTFEDIDPVRFLGNRSSGKMGFALAARAALRGADVTLVSGPVALATPWNVSRVDVRSALEMRDAIAKSAGSGGGADAIVMAAAVADFRPVEKKDHKIKKDDAAAVAPIALEKNPDLLAELGKRRQGKRPVLVGFALETGDDDAALAYARKKLASKKVDLVVANRADEALSGDTNRATLVAASGVEPLGPMTKAALADVILDRITRLL